jgi:hypothetical protein
MVLATAACGHGGVRPGRPPSRPRRADTVHSYMRKHRLPGMSARNTAMMETITDRPRVVVSDLFGMHPHTAYAWAQYAQNSWAEYLEAAQATEDVQMQTGKHLPAVSGMALKTPAT